MKCPLMLKVWKPGDEKKHWEPMDCLKEGCAWWSEAEGNCSMLLIAAYLGGLVAIGDKLLDKMPHEE